MSTVTMCRSCGTETTSIEKSNSILKVTIPTVNKKSFTLQEIIDENIVAFKSIDISCSTCNNLAVFQRSKVSCLQKIFIIQLSLFHGTHKQVKSKCSIKAVPTTKIKINESTYRVTSAIFDHGENVDSGHYTSMLRMQGTSWICADDSKIDKLQWPRMAKDIYIMFLEKVTSNSK